MSILKKIVFFLTLVFLLLLMTNCPGPAVYDPWCTTIKRTGFVLEANISNGIKDYDEHNWGETRCGDPTFTWIQIIPQSSEFTNYKVSYKESVVESGKNKWYYILPDSEGVFWYWVKAVFDSSGQSKEARLAMSNFNMTKHVYAYRVVNTGGYLNEIVNKASGYVHTPYVYAKNSPIIDVDGHGCWKCCTEHNGYCGIDCSGLCWYSDYEGDKDVCNTDAAYLEQYYGFIPNKTFADKENGDMIFVDVDQDGMVDHVGIYVNEWWHTDEMIHATATEWNIKPGQYPYSVMHEELWRRKYWSDHRFVDLGRKQ